MLISTVGMGVHWSAVSINHTEEKSFQFYLKRCFSPLLKDSFHDMNFLFLINLFYINSTKEKGVLYIIDYFVKGPLCNSDSHQLFHIKFYLNHP